MTCIAQKKSCTGRLWMVLLLTSLSVSAQKPVQVASPDGGIVFTFQLSKTAPEYAVAYKGKPVIDFSPLSLSFENGLFKDNLRLGRPTFRDTTEDYELVVGKAKKVHTRYKEVILPLEESITPFRKINIRVRVFDDGLAFRYEFPVQQNQAAITLLDENTTFNLAGNPTAHTLFLGGYTTSHEGYYSTLPLSKIPPDSLMDMPTTFAFPGGVFMAITEAALLDYAGMYLSKHNNLLTSRLSPLPGQAEVKVKARLPHHSPWRVMLLGNRIGTLLESNIITTLNEPCKIADVSWIKPGKTTFPWWNGNVVPDTLNAPGNNFVTAKYYIDFCARNHLEYHSVVEYGLHQWYTDDGISFMPGPHADVTTPVPGLDMKQICDYAAKSGVGVRGVGALGGFVS